MPLTLSRGARANTRTSARVSDHLAGWRTLLDHVQANIFLADPDLTLVYANRRAMQTLRSIEPVFRAAFGVGVDQIVGRSIHTFHRNAEHVEAVLWSGHTRFPHAATFSFGEVFLRTNIDEVRDEAGVLLGYSVAWDDVTSLQRSRDVVGQLGEHLDAAASSVEELSASIGEIARSASDAAERTSVGTAAATQVTDTVRDLDATTATIDGVVRTITTIAEQTNILALNATIEAARAGEAGKGFAVVAGEVKQLANDTAAATEDIGQRVTAIRRSASEVTEGIASIADLLGEIDAIQSSVASTVEQQRVASDELARSVSGAATSSRDAIAAQGTLNSSR